MHGGQFLYWDPHGRHSKVTASSGSLQHSKVTAGNGSLQHCKVTDGGTQQEKTESGYSSLIDEKKPTITTMQRELNDQIAGIVNELQIIHAIKSQAGRSVTAVSTQAAISGGTAQAGSQRQKCLGM